MDMEDLAAGVELEDFAVAELGGLLRYAVILTGDRELARDLVQDVMLKAYTQWVRVAGRGPAPALCRTMVTRAFLHGVVGGQFGMRCLLASTFLTVRRLPIMRPRS
jgi:DNA-directed RNA polymerase specialized sigma24 family protein